MYSVVIFDLANFVHSLPGVGANSFQICTYLIGLAIGLKAASPKYGLKTLGSTRLYMFHARLPQSQ